MIKRIGLLVLVVASFAGMELVGRAVGLEGQGHSPPVHSHAYSDIRLRLVEVLSLADGKIAVADLEEHTVGLDLIYEPDPEFKIALAVLEKDKPPTLKRIEFQQMLHRHGVITYCLYCGKALTFTAYERRE